MSVKNSSIFRPFQGFSVGFGFPIFLGKSAQSEEFLQVVAMTVIMWLSTVSPVHRSLMERPGENSSSKTSLLGKSFFPNLHPDRVFSDNSCSSVRSYEKNNNKNGYEVGDVNEQVIEDMMEHEYTTAGVFVLPVCSYKEAGRNWWEHSNDSEDSSPKHYPCN